VKATGRVGDVEFEFEVPPEFVDLLRIDPEGFEIGFRGIKIDRGRWVNDPCGECGHDRECHRDGIAACARCECKEWWKVFDA
jgi:hypothetical protein